MELHWLMFVFRSDLGPRCMSPKPKHGFSPRGGGGTSSNQSESEGSATTLFAAEAKSCCKPGWSVRVGWWIRWPCRRIASHCTAICAESIGCVHFDAAGWFGSCSFLGRSEQAGGGFVNPEYIASPCWRRLPCTFHCCYSGSLEPSDICAAMVRVAHGRPFCGDIQIAHLGYAAKQERRGPKPATNSSCCQTLDSFRIAQHC